MESIKIIEQALDIAMQKGAYKLADATVIATAFNNIKSQILSLEQTKNDDTQALVKPTKDAK